MDKIIDKAEQRDLTGDDLKNICRGKVEIIPYHTLNEYESIEQLLSKFGAVILLYELKENFGHYVALFYNKDNDLEFFDSYGMKPDEELKYATYNLDNGVPYLTKLLDKRGKKVVVNTRKFQAFKHEVNTCGRWTSIRILFKEQYSLADFTKLFSSFKYYSGDFWVSALTFLITENDFLG